MPKKGDTELIKKMNKQLITKTIRENNSISRADISKITHLSRSTVSIIVDDLIKDGLVSEIGLSDSTNLGGRRAMKLLFNPDSMYGVGVDIGGTKIFMVITNLDGEVVKKEKVPSDSNPDNLIRIIHTFLTESGIEWNKINAMGVGVPAVVNSSTGVIIDSPQLGWQNYDFLSELKKTFSFPIFINNDVNCAVFGEQWLGSAKDVKDLFFIAIGTGVGSAIISNGRLIEGNGYSAGEIGYFIDIKDIENNNRNQFGSFGAFEKKTSGSYLSSHGVPGEELFRRFYLGDKDAGKIIEEFILSLSISLANVTSLLNPEQIVIGGGVSNSMHGILDAIEHKVKQLTPVPTKICLSSLKNEAGAIGSIAYAFHKIQEL